MQSDKVRKFMQLGGQTHSSMLRFGNQAERRLGAQLLLSEVLEYVIHGLGVYPEYNGMRIEHPDEVVYSVSEREPDAVEMLDGLADTAYTMYWNAEAFGLPLEAAYDLVCDNNLQKFVLLEKWNRGEIVLERPEWDCGCGITWPAEVARVSVVRVNGEFYAVGKDQRGKVRKPSSYAKLDLAPLVSAASSDLQTVAQQPSPR